MTLFSKLTKSLFLFNLIFFSQLVFSFDSFEITDIQVDGIQRITAGTVFNYLPLKVGDTVTEDSAANAMHVLYKTGFFKDVSLNFNGDVLIVAVIERPAISSIEFDGNKDIETEELKKSLKGVGFAEGRVFDQSVLDRVVEELRSQYYARGKYSVRLDAIVKPLERNRVSVKLDISEGRVSKIKKINIVGNQVYDEETILEEMALSKPSFFSFYTKNDQYSKQKLSGDLAKIKAFYLNRGYINFNIESTQVSITPDKKNIYLTINVVEGKKFTVSEVKLSGDLILSKEELKKLVKINKGDTFSRRNIAQTNELIIAALGKEGYGFANVNPIPEVNNENSTVEINFFIEPGSRTYVRRVNIFGNSHTADHVIRRELRQQESSWLSTEDIKRGKERLNKLGYFSKVGVETKRIAGSNDLVDINYTVAEQSTGSINAGMGYSQTGGIIFNFSISQRNFLGTGNNYTVAVNTSSLNQLLNLSTTNPYYTKEGISRTWYISHKKTNNAVANLSNYQVNRNAFGLNFSIPVNEYNRYSIGFDTEYLKIDLPNDTFNTADNTIDFVTNEGGGEFLTLRANASWSHDSRNRAIFPDRGTLMRLRSSLAVPGSKHKYFKLSYKQTQYFPLLDSLALMLTGNLAYAAAYAGDVLPPFEYYYAGGINSVRGFRDNTLGAIDKKTQRAIGGALKAVANAEVIIPVPFIKDSNAYRLSTFVDIGNTFENIDTFSANDLRYTTGVAAAWLSPFGLLRFSFGYPLNDKPGDYRQFFQFSFGQQF